jgi:hypothetical protein
VYLAWVGVSFERAKITPSQAFESIYQTSPAVRQIRRHTPPKSLTGKTKPLGLSLSAMAKCYLHRLFARGRVAPNELECEHLTITLAKRRRFPQIAAETWAT